MIIVKGLGYHPDHIDHRDQYYAFTPTHSTETLPDHVDHSNIINWVYDQGLENSCVGQSSTSLVRVLRLMSGLGTYIPSRNFTYWNARYLDQPPNTNSDNGAQLRNGLISLANYGYIPETMWGYNKATLFNQPPQECYNTAIQNKLSSYNSINQVSLDIRSCLASKPFVVGIAVYPSMLTEDVAHNGLVPLPGSKEKPQGGHAILIMGYDAPSHLYKFLNSWGMNWGDKGYGYLPFDFLESQYLAQDLWTGTIVAPPPKNQGVWWNPFGSWNMLNTWK